MLGPPDRGRVLGRRAVLRQLLGVQPPQPVGRLREALQLVRVGLPERPAERLPPCPQRRHRLRRELPHEAVAVAAHARVRQQEVVDRPRRTGRRRPPADRVGLPPEPPRVPSPPGGDLRPRVRPPPRAHQRVAGEELVPEPRHVPVLHEAVQPQRHLGQLHRHRVQVDPEHVPVGDVVPRALQLLGALPRRNAPPQLPLAPLQIALRQLVDGLVQERRRPHRRLAHPQLQDPRGRHARVDALLQGLPHHRPRQRLGRVEARRPLALAPRPPEQEPALRVAQQPPAPPLVPDVDPLLLRVPLEGLRGHEPGRLQLVPHAPGDLHLVQVLPGDGAPERQQGLVHPAEVADAQLTVRDAPPPAPSLRRPGQREQAQDPLHDLVAQPGALQQRRPGGVEQPAVERLHAERAVQRPLLERQPPLPPRRRLEALPHELEEAVQAAPDVLAVPVPGRLQTRHLQVPQPLEAVPSAVGLRVHRHVAQLRPRLAAEQEQQPVQVAQALRPQPLRQVAAPGLRPRRLAPQRAQRLVAQQLDGLAQRVPELARDPERVPVAALVERVQQGRPRPRQRRLAVQQGRRGPQRGPLATVQDAPPVEAQQAPLGPLAAL